MRPTPNEVVDGIRRVLADSVRPAITDEYARARLEEVRAVLAQIDWDDVALRLLREHRHLAELVSRLQRQLGRPGPVPAQVPVEPPEDFSALASARSVLDAWVVDCLDTNCAISAELRVEIATFYLDQA